jgi:hypothetical protein
MAAVAPSALGLTHSPAFVLHLGYGQVILCRVGEFNITDSTFTLFDETCNAFAAFAASPTGRFTESPLPTFLAHAGLTSIK